MSGLYNTKIDSIISSVLRTYEIDAEYGEGPNIDKYTSLVEHICKLEGNITKSQEALEKAKNSSSLQEFQNIYSEEMKKSTTYNAKNSNRYQNFISKVEMVAQSGQNCVVDDDLEIEGEFSELDPMTKQKLRFPVRNKICNHVYEKSSIEESLKLNSRLRCPVSGCPNKKHVNLVDLVEDIALRRKIEDRQNNM